MRFFMLLQNGRLGHGRQWPFYHIFHRLRFAFSPVAIQQNSLRLSENSTNPIGNWLSGAETLL